MKKTLAILLILLAAISGPSRAEPYYRVWCPDDDPHGRTAVFVLNAIGTTSVLLEKGKPPNYLPHQEQVFIPLTDDRNDLRGIGVWVVEGRQYHPCAAGIPSWAGEFGLVEEVPLNNWVSWPPAEIGTPP